MTPPRVPVGRNDAIEWTMAAVVFWATTAFLGVLMFNAVPRIAAFDLDLLVEAARAVAAGQSPYDPALLRGVAPEAVDLFYSYPPIVGQALVLVSGLPLGIIAIAWSVAAIALLAVAVVRVGAIVAPAVRPAVVAAATVATAAMTFPLLIAILFGNLDAFFPALYGFVLVAALSRRPADAIVGGVAIAIGTLTKVYPGGLGLWFLVRAVRARSAAERRPLLVPIVAAVASTAALVALSVGLFGTAPWLDYATVASTAARAEVVDGRNAAPAAQLALWLGLDSGAARLLHLPVAAAAVAAIVVAAWRVADPLTSLAIAATASLLVLPISWIHYPAALLPFVAAAVLRVQAGEPAVRRRVRALAAGALLAAAGAVTWMPSLWIALALAMGAVWSSTDLATGTAQSPRTADASPG